MATANARLILSEYQEAVLLADYLSTLEMMGKVLVFAHIPNETFTKSWAIKRRNKEQGVKQGVPDYIIVTPKKVLFVELKRTKGGVLSTEQAKWLFALKDKTTDSAVAKGFDQAKQYIDSHL